MTKAEKVQYTINELERLYPETLVPLDHKDPFTLLVAVVLSAQCTDVRVNKITPKLFAVESCSRNIFIGIFKIGDIIL